MFDAVLAVKDPVAAACVAANLLVLAVPGRPCMDALLDVWVSVDGVSLDLSVDGQLGASSCTSWNIGIEVA